MSSKILGFIKTETAQVIAGFVCVLLLLWAFGCESTVQSLDGNGIQVTRPELALEVEVYIAKAEQRFLELDRKDQLKALFFDKLMLFSQTGSFNPMGIIPTIISILGIGAIADNTRKRYEIKRSNGKPPEI